MTNSGGGGPCLSSLMDNGSVECLRFYLARRTVIEMLRDRGYVVPNLEAELHRSLADFRAAFGDKSDADGLRLLASRASGFSRKILVIFAGNFEIRKQNMVGILSQIMNKETLDRVILILQDKINSHARKVLNDYSVKVETFPITDLLVNITKHVLQPTFEILTAHEKQKLLKMYSIEDKQLPKMLESDAFARYYGLEKGQVVKVSYHGPHTDTVVTYRSIE